MLTFSGLFSVISLAFSVYLFFASFSVNFIPPTQNFTIDELPFVVTISHHDLSEDSQMNEEPQAEKENKKKSQKKQWQFTDSQPNMQNQSKQQPYIQQMKSQLENSSSATQGTAENSTMLKIYLHQ
ncbi:MAG: hypothetical protein QNJ42_21510 [Crocosphaera sp.]|nr:hypothetical protein [Crocosphaera sp.]